MRGILIGVLAAVAVLFLMDEFDPTFLPSFRAIYQAWKRGRRHTFQPQAEADRIGEALKQNLKAYSGEPARPPLCKVCEKPERHPFHT